MPQKDPKQMYLRKAEYTGFTAVQMQTVITCITICKVIQQLFQRGAAVRSEQVMPIRKAEALEFQGAKRNGTVL